VRRWLEKLDGLNEALESEIIKGCPNCQGDESGNGCDQCNALWHMTWATRHLIGALRTNHNNPRNPTAHESEQPTA
jgi:hypothetical protein